MMLKILVGFIMAGSVIHSCNNGNSGQQSASSKTNDTVLFSAPAYEILANNGLFRIEGTLANGAGRQIFIQELPKQQPGMPPQAVLLDTSIVKPDGSFVLEGKTNEKQLAIIGTDQQHLIYTLIDGGQFNFQGDYNNFGQASLSGSKEVNTSGKFFNGLNEHFLVLNQAQSTLQNAETNKMPESQIAPIRNASNKAMDSYYGFLKEFMDTSYSKVIGLFAATILDIGVDYPYITDYYNRTATSLPNHKYITDLANKLAQYSYMINTVAPDINLPTPKGDSIALSSLKGKVVLLDFWAAWCMPCRRENPNVVRVYEKYKDAGFTVYSVSLDKTKSAWEKAIKDDKLTWENHVSELAFWQTQAIKPYGVNSIPAAFLIDREGKIAAKNLRGYALERKVAEMVSKR